LEPQRVSMSIRGCATIKKLPVSRVGVLESYGRFLNVSKNGSNSGPACLVIILMSTFARNTFIKKIGKLCR
jgi:hypothetical protein